GRWRRHAAVRLVATRAMARARSITPLGPLGPLRPLRPLRLGSHPGIGLRVLLCLAVAIGSARAAWADKPRIAVLGLEVAQGPGGGIDPGAQLIAREITKELRQ